MEKRKYRRQRQRKVQQQPPASTQQQQHQLLPSQLVLHPQLTEKEKVTSVKLAQRSVPLPRHLNKDKNKEREKEKERNKTKDKDKVMAERHSNAQERRIHELDHNVERYFEVRKVSVVFLVFLIFFSSIDSLIAFTFDKSAWARAPTALCGRQRISEKRTQLLSKRSTMLFGTRQMHSAPTER